MTRARSTGLAAPDLARPAAASGQVAPELPVSFDWPVTERREIVGALTFDLVSLVDFEATVDELYKHLRGRGTQQQLEDLSPMFGVIWGSARAIAHRVAALGPGLSGRRVLELGCGLALPSLVAGRLGAEVVASDQHPQTQDFLLRNIARNEVSGVTYRRLDWRALPHDLGRFDLVVASDVLFARELPALVAATFARTLRSGGLGLLADPGRAWLSEFADAAVAEGLTVELDVDRVPTPTGTEDLFVLALRPRS